MIGNWQPVHRRELVANVHTPALVPAFPLPYPPLDDAMATEKLAEGIRGFAKGDPNPPALLAYL